MSMGVCMVGELGLGSGLFYLIYPRAGGTEALPRQKCTKESRE